MQTNFNESQTKINLMRAFAGESQSRMRYYLAALTAQKQYLVGLERMFRFTADQEEHHAQVFFDLLRDAAGEDILINADFPADSYTDLQQLLDAAAKGENIVMKSLGEQLRSYCHVLDCASAILAVLIKGENRNAYNISAKQAIVTIREMAEAFAAAGGVEIVFDVPTDAEKKSYNVMPCSALNAEKLEALGWKAAFDMKAGAEQTVRELKNMLK